MNAPILATRVRKARRAGTCAICRGPIRIGEQIAKTIQWAHAGCVIANLYKNSTEEKTSPQPGGATKEGTT